MPANCKCTKCGEWSRFVDSADYGFDCKHCEFKNEQGTYRREFEN